MKATCGVFRLQADAERAAGKLRSNGLHRDRITLLVPEDITEQVERLPRSADEGPGVGLALGLVMGAAIGLAGGFELVGILGTPVSGNMTAGGLWGVAILGLAGAALGAGAGWSLDNAISQGLTRDQLEACENALRNGFCIVLAFTHDGKTTKFVRRVLAAEGAETLGKARRNGRFGLRGAQPDECVSEISRRARTAASDL